LNESQYKARHEKTGEEEEERYEKMEAERRETKSKHLIV
jgi:hypothetical protein